MKRPCTFADKHIGKIASASIAEKRKSIAANVEASIRR
jgi:hypothetical protein